MKRFWTGFILGVLASIVAPLLIVASGAINFAATTKPSRIEKSLAQFAGTSSIAQRLKPETLIATM